MLIAIRPESVILRRECSLPFAIARPMAVRRRRLALPERSLPAPIAVPIREKTMNEHDGDRKEAGVDDLEKRADARRSKTTRFSDPEWELVERAANKQGIPAAEYVRNAAMDAAMGRTAALDAEMVETIRRIYRSTYIVATLKRDEMLREGREGEIKSIVEEARKSQAALAGETSKSAG